MQHAQGVRLAIQEEIVGSKKELYKVAIAVLVRIRDVQYFEYGVIIELISKRTN